MQYFIDHLTSILVVSGVLLIIVIVQIRGTQTIADSTINSFVYSDVMNITTYLQRDIENMLTETQANDALAAGRYPGAGLAMCNGADTTTGGTHSALHTASFVFPTLEDPDNPLTSNVIQVEYDLVNTGKTITLPTQDSTQTIPVFRLNRLVDGVFSGSSDDIVTAFRIDLLNEGDAFTAFTPMSAGACTVALKKVRFEFKMAQNGFQYDTQEQRSTSQLNISRFGTTIHLSNWD